MSGFKCNDSFSYVAVRLSVHNNSECFPYRATGADEMCNFYMMYWYDPAKGRSSDACEPMLFQTSDYPAETDEPLTTKKTMKMKRERDGG